MLPRLARPALGQAARQLGLLAGLHLPTSSGQLRLCATEAQQQALVGDQLLVDTLALTKTFEKAGLDRESSERLSEAMTRMLVSNKVKMDGLFVGKHALEKAIMEQHALIQAFKTELSKTQDIHVSSSNKDLERQQSYLEKMRADLKHEIDKLTASQRLDMNLEKGRMRDDAQVLRDKTTDLQLKLDRDINELRSAVEKSKNDNIKFVITILGTFSAVAFTLSRFMQGT